MKRYLLLTLLLVVFVQFNFGANKSNIKDKVVFATIAEATALLNTHDEYTNGWSQFDIDAKVKKLHSTKEEQFKNLTAQLRAWTPEEIERINARLLAIDKIITKNAYHINTPDKIIFIKSTMKDEDGADGYTRANCIVLKDDVLSLTKSQLQDIVTHELFHVVTRHDSIFRKNLYSIIGFQMMNEVPYPDNIKDYKISNPDAVKKDSYIKVRKDGNTIECMMILYSEREYAGGSFFDYFSIGLLKLKGKVTKEIDYVDGNPVISQLKDVSDFFKQVGKNTPYIIDPEEILAENFVFAINNKKGLPDQFIVDKIQMQLKL